MQDITFVLKFSKVCKIHMLACVSSNLSTKTSKNPGSVGFTQQ